jgi:glycosyltransferase involved in cell wall biosynthesis
MRILSLTAGAGGMYCGSCLRDNALAAELLARGHEVTLIPLYTPLLTDEANVTRSKVLFGGISVYLQQHSALFRHMPRFVDRLFDSPGLIGRFADRSVSTDPRMLGDLTISMLEGADGVLRREFDKLIEWTRGEPRPDVINLTNSMLIALARPLAEAFDRPVCCTLQGEDLFLEGLTEPYRARARELIRQQVPHVDRFIAISEYYAKFMTRYLQIPADAMSVVPLGINLAGFERRERSEDDVFRVGYFARIAPEKGLHLLADAFRRLRKRPGTEQVRLEAAGYMAPADAKYLADIKRSLEQAGLANDFSYHGASDRDGKLAFLRRLDVLSVPAVYDDPKGLSLLEAMASGVPVVQPRRGAFTEIVERTGGGLLCEPDNANSLADGLYRLWQDATLRQKLARQGYESVRAQYTIQHSADCALEVFTGVIGARNP